MAFYRCKYILRTEVCGRDSYRPEGCGYHWKFPQRIPCKECGKLTYSTYGVCNNHVGKYQKRENYRRKKQAKLLKKYNHENGYVKLDEIP